MDTGLKPFQSSQEVFSWLGSFTNLEAGQIPKSFNPKRMDALMEAAGNPQRRVPSIHVAGSKGKGSLTGMITAILEAAGFRVLQFVSPHVRDFRERITQGFNYLDERVYIAAGEELRRFMGSLPAALGGARRLFDQNEPEGCAPTYFELLTLYFFLCAGQTPCDLLAVETGMGGLQDPTNVVDPLAAVITVIELEHTEFLGPSVASVAEKKAGIIKQGKPLFLAPQQEAALEVFRKTAQEKNAPLYYFPEIAGLRNLRVHKEGSDFTLVCKTPGFFPEPLDLSIAIPGAAQAQNAGLAALAVRRCFPAIGKETIQRGLAGFTLPARFERLWPLRKSGPPLIIDGAHTERSVELTAATFYALYGGGGVLIFGCAEGKNAAAMAALLEPRFSRIFITAPGTFKASNPREIYRIFAGQLERSPNKAALALVLDPGEALRQALAAAAADCLPILGTGSFYLAAELRRAAGA
ncbi:MAG: tetrahydrofolate synthase [Treponema sp.]|jgi:dihydrofolate synthase/folylpolyglutamate synthase|nr:tetrahydrofolate synthase [Treponema sp.]